MTSSVGTMAERRMLEVIREAFKESMIIAVAYRLNMITEYDQVIVMDSGRVVEMGRPADLLEKEGGWFKGLWERKNH